MSPVIITLLVLLGVGLLLALWFMGIYNGLVVARNRFGNAFAQIDVQLKRRYELIPNLVESVKGYMGHERETLDAVIKARNSAMAVEQKVAANPSDPATMRELNHAEAQLGGALGRLFALSEAYPDLKANQNMLALQEELTSTENKIGFARQAFVAAFELHVDLCEGVLEAVPGDHQAVVDAHEPEREQQPDAQEHEQGGDDGTHWS